MRTAIWAMDPFQGDQAFHACAAAALRSWMQASGAAVEPVHVLSPIELNLAIEASLPWLEQYRRSAEKAMGEVLASVGLKDAVQPPRVLVREIASTVQAVDELISYAEAKSADLILASSHGRSGMSRLLLGSFAETLLLRSPVPVVVCGSRMTRTATLGNVFHPTSFGEHSEAVFRRVVEFTSALHGRLALFHMLSRSVEPVFQSGVYLLGSSYMPVTGYYDSEREEEDARRRSAAWARWAEHQGVATEALVEPPAVNFADQIVRRAAATGAGLIALEAQSGRVASMLLGSVVRRVIRYADCPVWVLRGSLAQAQRAPRAAA